MKQAMDQIKSQVLTEEQRHRVGRVENKIGVIDAIQRLKLTDDQKKQIRQIQEEAKDAAEKATSPQDKKKALQDALKKINDEVLTDDQAPAVEELAQGARLRPPAARGRNRPWQRPRPEPPAQQWHQGPEQRHHAGIGISPSLGERNEKRLDVAVGAFFVFNPKSEIRIPPIRVSKTRKFLRSFVDLGDRGLGFLRLALEIQVLLGRLALVLGSDGDDDSRQTLVIAAEDFLAERVFDHVLDGPAQRPGAEVGVVALGDEEVLGLVREHEFEAARRPAARGPWRTR